MSDSERFGGKAEAGAEAEGRIEVEDSGETLEAALAEEERSAMARAEERLQAAQKDLTELKDRHLRKLAEMENMKKRAAREREETFRDSLMKFARDFLPVGDHFELAMRHAPPEERQSDFGQGIGLIRRQLADLWKGYGLEEVDTSGAFDPNVHEAVMTEISEDVPPQTILGVLQKGYALDGRLVRPALVKVAIRAPEPFQSRAGDAEDERGEGEDE